jgi:hypothetical protein
MKLSENKPYSRWEWRLKRCPECKGRGGFGEGDDFEICWNCDDGYIPYEVEIDMTQQEWDEWHQQIREKRYLKRRYDAGIPESIADFWLCK